MLGIHNPEIPVQSAAPIRVLLDNLAVPSEARIRSICFPRSCWPGIGMRLDGFPDNALAERAIGNSGCRGFEGKALSKNGSKTVWQWGRGHHTMQAEFWTPQSLSRNKCNQGDALKN